MENSYPSRQPYGAPQTAAGILARSTQGNGSNSSLFQNYYRRHQASQNYYRRNQNPSQNSSYQQTYGSQWRGSYQTAVKTPQVRTPKVPHQRVLNGVTYEIRQGSITDYEGDAIVNAANEQGLGGGGVDGAITSAGGQELAKARSKLEPIWSNVRIRTGDARTTVAGNLKCKYVIHAVGPNLSRPKATLNELKAAYTSAIAEAYMYDVNTIAFPIISGGVFSGNYPLQKIIQTAFEALNGSEGSVKTIVFYGFKAEEVSLLVGHLNSITDSRSQ